MRRGRRGRTPAPWEWLRTDQPAATEVLDRLHRAGELTGIDHARLVCALDHARRRGTADELAVVAGAIVRHGAAALPHASARRSLPGVDLGRHDLVHGQVRLGRTVPSPHGTVGRGDTFAVDHDVLRTSLLAIGPPGSGKTHGIARPIVEHLVLSGLTNQASVVVVDVKGDDFADDGWFDVTVDPLDPRTGLDLYGGAPNADIAADRLASALLPARTSDDLAYFVDASKNALYACLFPFRLAFERWPTVREMLALLRVEQGMTDKLRAALNARKSDPAAKDARRRLDERRAQRNRRHDPSVSLIERFTLLDRPALTGLFDHADAVFPMSDINRPTRVRIVLREAQFPDAARILARLVVAQFVNTATSVDSNRDIYKGLVVDEAGRFVDDYVARGMQMLRSANAGLVLLTQTLSDIPEHIRGTVFGSSGCKVAFGGIGTEDAEIFSAWFGDEERTEITRQRSTSEQFGESSGLSFGVGGPSWHRGRHHGMTVGNSVSSRRYERARWTVSDLTTGLGAGRCVAALTRSTGERFGPAEIDLRA